jgi:hypothetical protein
MKLYRLLAIFGLLVTATAFAGGSGGGTAKSEVDAHAAFSRLKGLAGEWNVDSTRGRGHSRFDVIANDSVVLEHFSEPGAEEMLTAYHLDGNRLVLTHYCLAGNQPRMVADKFDPSSGELDFAFAGGSNIAPGVGHMHDASFRFVSADNFSATWDFVEAGKVKFSEEIRYTRVK